MTKAQPEKRSLKSSLSMIFTDRQVLAIFILGLASGLPYSAVGGTLNAWLSTTDVKISTIGLLSWAGLAYAFKFMWAAALQSRKTPFDLKIGPRRFWMLVFQVLITAGLFVLAFSNPPNGIGTIALVSVIIALFSSSFDIVSAAWRIESARDEAHLDIMSTAEQFGYRIASLLSGFVAFLLADKFGWRPVFMGGAVLMASTIIGVLLAAPSPLAQTRAEAEDIQFRQGVDLSTKLRHAATLAVLAGWLGGFYLIGRFMYGAITDPASYSARAFMRSQGPVVIGLTVVLLIVVASVLVWQDTRESDPRNIAIGSAQKTPPLDILYIAIIEPMMEIVGRLKWSAVLVLALVMTYRFTDAIWGSFAYPFYMGQNFGALGHTLTEVGFASKFVGVIATIVGIAIAGVSMLRYGRMPVLVAGAILAAITNLIYADLANGAPGMDAFLAFTHLGDVLLGMNLDQRMARLVVTITAENIAGGLASAVTIAYLSSIVNKEYAAVQYALLASLMFLFGTLGRPLIGEIIEDKGFQYTFILCAWLGAIAVVLSILEWIRQSRLEKPA